MSTRRNVALAMTVALAAGVGAVAYLSAPRRTSERADPTSAADGAAALGRPSETKPTITIPGRPEQLPMPVPLLDPKSPRREYESSYAYQQRILWTTKLLDWADREGLTDETLSRVNVALADATMRFQLAIAAWPSMSDAEARADYDQTVAELDAQLRTILTPAQLERWKAEFGGVDIFLAARVSEPDGAQALINKVRFERPPNGPSKRYATPPPGARVVP